MHRLYLSLGSNLGHRHAHISRALQLLGERVGRVERVSQMIETEPWGYDSPHKYINACCLVLTDLTPRQCLAATQQIERELGRERKTAGQYADRPIDIDMLMYDDLTLDEPDLTLPHPRMAQRDFVMTPLRQIT